MLPDHRPTPVPVALSHPLKRQCTTTARIFCVGLSTYLVFTDGTIELVALLHGKENTAYSQCNNNMKCACTGSRETKEPVGLEIWGQCITVL